MEIAIKGTPKEIAALVVGLQGRQDMVQSHHNHDEGNRERHDKGIGVTPGKSGRRKE